MLYNKSPCTHQELGNTVQRLQAGSTTNNSGGNGIGGLPAPSRPDVPAPDRYPGSKQSHGGQGHDGVLPGGGDGAAVGEVGTKDDEQSMREAYVALQKAQQEITQLR